jgi:hypothetical protein
MEKHAKNRRLWDRVIYRSSTGRLTKTIYAFVLGLVQRLFCTPIPEPLNSWQGAAISPTLQAWLSHFALDWALSDWPGSLNNLFLAAEFIPNRSDRLKYWQSRLFPGKTQTSLGAIATASAKNFLQLQAARLNYVARRAAVHLTGIADLPRQQLRWRRALAATRGSGLRANS